MKEVITSEIWFLFRQCQLYQSAASQTWEPKQLSSLPDMNPCVTLASLPLDDAEVFTSPSLFFFFFFLAQLTFYLSSKVFHRGKQSSITRAERNHYTDDSQVGPVYRTTSAANRDFLNGLGRPHKKPSSPCNDNSNKVGGG